MRGEIAKRLGFHREPAVIIGGNDAVLAAYSIGIKEPGDYVDVNGTCEISMVCLDKCYFSTKYNIRAHVIPDRWVTLYVMNAEGAAFEWFRGVFCSEMSYQDYYQVFHAEGGGLLGGPGEHRHLHAIPDGLALYA